jgi:hypothetical protein
MQARTSTEGSRASTSAASCCATSPEHLYDRWWCARGLRNVYCGQAPRVWPFRHVLCTLGLLHRRLPAIPARLRQTAALCRGSSRCAFINPRFRSTLGTADAGSGRELLLPVSRFCRYYRPRGSENPRPFLRAPSDPESGQQSFLTRETFAWSLQFAPTNNDAGSSAAFVALFSFENNRR